MKQYFEIDSKETNGVVELTAIRSNLGGDELKILVTRSVEVPISDLNPMSVFFFNQNSTKTYDLYIDVWLNGYLLADHETLKTFLFIVENNKIDYHRVIGLLNGIHSDIKLRKLKKHPTDSKSQEFLDLVERAIVKTGKLPKGSEDIKSSYGLTSGGVQYKRSIRYHNGKALYQTRWFYDIEGKVLDNLDDDYYGLSASLSITQEPVPNVDILPDEVAEKLLAKISVSQLVSKTS